MFPCRPGAGLLPTRKRIRVSKDVPVFDKVLIGGEWVPAANGTYDIINPATEEVLAVVRAYREGAGDKPDRDH